MKWVPDQTVLIVNLRVASTARRSGTAFVPEQARVAKVGRTLVHVARGSGAYITKFYADTGFENAGVYSATERIFTPEGWAEEGQRLDVLDELRGLGVELYRGGLGNRLSLATLTTIRDAINNDLED